eukprot:scaffold252020_cov28-Tisochrysis_lutea.AAC.4
MRQYHTTRRDPRHRRERHRARRASGGRAPRWARRARRRTDHTGRASAAQHSTRMAGVALWDASTAAGLIETAVSCAETPGVVFLRLAAGRPHIEGRADGVRPRKNAQERCHASEEWREIGSVSGAWKGRRVQWSARRVAARCPPQESC